MSASLKKPTSRQGWKQNPAAVKADILEVSIAEFAANGLSGARIDDIAAKTQTSKRMIYYYFGDKDGLYTAALEAAYARVRTGESALDLAHLAPADALQKLVAFTFDHHRANPAFIRMVMIENIHNAEFLERSDTIRNLNLTAIENLRDICARGAALGLFRRDIDAVRLHWQISALSFFNVSNRATFGTLYGPALFENAAQDDLRAEVVRMVIASVRA